MKIYTLTIKQADKIIKHKGAYHECLMLLDRLDLGLVEVELTEETLDTRVAC